MELFEEIRREYEHGVGTIRGVAKKLGVHRRMVREAVASAVPTERKIAVRERPKLGPAITFINAILEADQKAPRKQRHTAHRIWRRLCDEMPELKVCESTVGKYIRERKLELGLIGREIFIPQSYKSGKKPKSIGTKPKLSWMENSTNSISSVCAAWAVAGLSTVRIRTRASRRFWKLTSLPSTTLAAFSQRFDMTTCHRRSKKSCAVIRRRNERFIAFRSHWGFQSEFCTPGQGHEKGGVEGEGGYFRRNHLVPVPKAQGPGRSEPADRGGFAGR